MVLVNLLPVSGEMELAVNGNSLGKMRSGVATGPLPLGPGNNPLSLTWGEDRKAEGKVTAKPGETSIVVAFADPEQQQPGAGGGVDKEAFTFAELPSGTRVSQPQFIMFSGLPEPVSLEIDGQPVTVNPNAAKKVGGTSGRIKVEQGKNTLLELDANAPAVLDGPMRWYLFVVRGAEEGALSVVPVADFKYEW